MELCACLVVQIQTAQCLKSSSPACLHPFVCLVVTRTKVWLGVTLSKMVKCYNSHALWKLYTKSKYFSLGYDCVAKWGFGSRVITATILTCLHFCDLLINDCGPCAVHCLHHFVAIYLLQSWPWLLPANCAFEYLTGRILTVAIYLMGKHIDGMTTIIICMV